MDALLSYFELLLLKGKASVARDRDRGAFADIAALAARDRGGGCGARSVHRRAGKECALLGR